MRLELTTNEKFKDALLSFIRHQGIEFREGLRIQGRLLAEQIIKFTPPKNRAQGNNAVRRDIGRVFNPLNPNKLTKISRLIRSRDNAALQRFIDGLKDGPLKGKKVISFSPSVHRNMQKSRGRVQTASSFVTPDFDEVKAYIKKIQKNVGQAKGGWAASVNGLGGSVSSWIDRHRGSGSMEDRTNEVPAYITMTNASVWASGGDDGRIVANAIQSRTVRIVKGIQRAQAAALHKAKLA